MGWLMASVKRNQPKPDVNIVVCADEYGCQRWYSQGRNAEAVLQELRAAIGPEHADRVQVTTAGCILGCTYGPRFDVVRRWSGEKALYGAIAGEATITRRGRVQFAPIPESLEQVISDNLPERAVPVADLCGAGSPADVDRLRDILLDCSRGIDRSGQGLAEAVVMVHNSAAVSSIPATLADLDLVDGEGRPDEAGGIAVLTTDGDGRVAIQLSRIRQVEFMQRTLGNGMPSYAIWMRDENLETVYRVYLRRSEDAAANPLRHRLFMDLIERYGERVSL
jgi:hypothetical protein